MKTIILIGLTMLMCSAFSCEKNPLVEKVFRLRVQNNTGMIINYLVSYDYPDTSIPDSYNKLSGIGPMDYTPYDSKEDWDREFGKTKSGKMSFFFFSPDTIKAYGWDNVRNNNRILGRKDISLQDLKDSNYVVAYP